MEKSSAPIAAQRTKVKMATAIKEASTFNKIPNFVPFGVVVVTKDTGDLYIGTGSSNGPAVTAIFGSSLPGYTVFNVFQYGATGNGVTDDTAAINNAIAACGAVNGILYFPTGAYLVSSTLTISAAMRIMGASQNGAVIFLKAGSNCNVFNVTSSNVTFERLTINGNASNQTSGNLCGISYATTLSNFLLKNVSVLTCYSTGVFMLSASNVLIDGCAFQNSLGQQFLYQYTNGVASQNLAMVNSLFDSTGAAQPFVTIFIEPSNTTGSISNVLISNNTITFPQGTASETDGIVLNGSTGSVVISNNVISSPAGARTHGQNGIEIENVAGVTISGNSFFNMYNGIESQGTSNSGVTVIGNSFVGGAASVSSGAYAITLGMCVGAAIIGNSVSNHASSINITSSSQCLIEGNTIMISTASSATGITVYQPSGTGEDNSVIGNTVISNTGNQWCIESSGNAHDHLIIRNNFLSGSGQGIRCDATTYTNSTFSGNVFDGPSQKYRNLPSTGVTVIDDGAGNLNINTVLGFSAAGSTFSADTGISRTAAGTIAFGNGTAGSTSGIVEYTQALMTASASAPTSAGTAGTAGQIIYYSGNLYFCSVTGVAGSATWNKLNLTAV
jgi:Pectate lyase superfamily protein